MIEKASTLDRIYRRLLLTKLFTRGWGNPATIKRQFDFLRVLADRSECQNLVDENYPVTIDSDVQKGEVRIVDGHFRSPFDKYLPNVMPKEVKTSRFQLIVPTKWPTHRKPVCINMAGTGDHFFWRRRTFLARPLIKEYGIGSLLLENPFYGVRKPKEQLRSSLQHVNDLFVMGGGLILEGLAMLHWCEKQGYGPLGLTGVSMGGHMASLTATNWHKPIPLIPCLSWSSATPVFTNGVLSGAIPWPVLVTQYMGKHLEYEKEILRKLQKCPKSDAFRLGQEFVWNYPESLDDLKGLRQSGGAKTESPPTSSHRADTPKEQAQTKPSHTVSKPPVGAQNDLENLLGVSNQNTSDVEHARDASDHTKVTENSDGKSAIDYWPIGKGDLYATVGASSAGLDSDLSGGTGNFGPGTVSKSGKEVEVKFCAGNGSVVCNCQDDAVTSSSSTNAGNSERELEFLSKETAHLTSKYIHDNKINASDHSGTEPSTDHNSAINTKSKEKENVTKRAKISKKALEEEDLTKVKPDKLKSKIGVENYKQLKEEALQFMRGVMDVTTYIGNFSTPVDTSLVIVITALRDGYIPRTGVPSLADIWPGVEVRSVDCGHIHAFLFKQTEFRKAINDAFNTYMDKYENDDVNKSDAQTSNKS